MIKIFHIANLHLGLRSKNHADASGTLGEAGYKTLETLVGMTNEKTLRFEAVIYA